MRIVVGVLFLMLCLGLTVALLLARAGKALRAPAGSGYT